MSSEQLPPTQIRAEAPSDARGVHTVLLSAFPSADEADLVSALRASPAWAHSSVATRGTAGTVVAHALLTHCTIGGRPALALAPVAVHAEAQGAGLGTAVTEHVLRAARSASPASALPVVVLGHPAFYPRFGFVPAHTLGVRAPMPLQDADALMVLPVENMRPGVVRWAKEFGMPEPDETEDA